jgi:hypothetical protein
MIDRFVGSFRCLADGIGDLPSIAEDDLSIAFDYLGNHVIPPATREAKEKNGRM